MKITHPSKALILMTCFTLLTLSSTAAYADNIDDFIHAEMDSKKIPGLAVAVIHNNQVVKESAYGLASIELNVPATLNTSYSLASMTKIFTASAVMLLVQDGKISLDDSITKALPQLPAKWSHVTIRHCLSHTSGLPDAITDGVNVTPITGDRDELFKILADKPVKPAGEESVYNQTGYTILGMIIEKISGMPYAQFVETRLLKPSNITHATYGDAWAIIPGQATLYTALDVSKDRSKLLMGERGPVVLKDKIYRYGSKYMPDYMAAAGLINGTIDDLVNLEKTFSEGKLLSSISLKEMSTPFALKNGKEGNFGLGFVTDSDGLPFKAVSYGGGAATWRIAFPEKKLTVIVLTNLQGDEPQNIALQIAGLVEPEVMPKQSH